MDKFANFNLTFHIYEIQLFFITYFCQNEKTILQRLQETTTDEA